MRKLCTWTVLGIMLSSTTIFAQGEKGLDLLDEIEQSGNFLPMFPFQPTHNLPDNITNVRTWTGAGTESAGDCGFISCEGDHFIDGSGREIRFIGTNIGMKGCFPDHNSADRLAKELSRYGINIVRLHYVSHTIPEHGYPVLNSFIEPVQLERFDYLFAKLKENGIYIYFQLNIARKFGRVNGFENAHLLPYYKNGVDNVDARMIEFQKQFHREILEHVNPYTGIAYRDEPAISMLELANENSIVNSWFAPKYNFPNLVEPYRSRIVGQWNEWLLSKYGNTENLKTAWQMSGSPAMEETLIADNGPESDAGWKIQQSHGSSAIWQYRRASKRDKTAGKGYARLLVEETTGDKAAPKFYWDGLEIRKGNSYCLSFKIRTDSPMNLILKVSQAHAPWKDGGLSTTVRCTNEWKEFRYSFTASLTDDDMRLVLFNFVPGLIDIADVSLISGIDYSSMNLEEKNVDWPSKSDWFVSPQRAYDFTEFLYSIEKDYFTGLYRNVKDSIGVRQPVTGTQLGYGFNQPQAIMDYCDIHGYWCHPAFPGGKWDNRHWNLRNGAVVNSFGHPGSTFTDIARHRILGKPFTVSEYDHPNLNFWCAEADLMLAAMGAFQNWSGLMQFAWILDTDYEREYIWPMFDMCSAPQKLVHFPACYAMFVRGDVRQGSDSLVFARMSYADADIRAVADRRDADACGHYRSGLMNSLPLAIPSGVQVGEYPHVFHSEGHSIIRDEKDVPEAIREAYRNREMRSSTGELIWNWQQKDAGYFMVDTRNTKVFTGFVRGRSFDYKGMKLTPGRTRLDWLTLSLTLACPSGSPTESETLQPGSYLLAATGLVHNTGAKIVTTGEPGKISCSIPDGGATGTSPVLCEGIGAKLTFTGLRDKVRCYALDPDGNRMREIPVTAGATGDAVLEISPEYRTVWYELHIKE